jgi:hypothetical protein
MVDIPAMDRFIATAIALMLVAVGFAVWGTMALMDVLAYVPS